MVSHEDSFSHRGNRQLGNGLLFHRKLQQSFQLTIWKLSDKLHDHFMAVIIASHLSYKPCCVLAVWNPTMSQKMKKRREDSPSG